MSKKGMTKKSILILKLVLLWLMALGGVLFLSYYSVGESFSMVWIDLQSGFADCPLVPQYFRNEMLVISVFFIVVIGIVGITDELYWKTIFGDKKLILTPGTRWVHIIINIGLCVAVVLSAYVFSLSIKPTIKYMSREGWNGDELIAHACGGIDNTDYTNSLEAFELSYAQGIRTMEVDFFLTADERMVCCHDWNRELSSEYGEGYVYTEEEFMNIKIYDKYTPMSVDMLLELMKKYDDVWIVTDTKESEAEAVRKGFRFLVERAEATESMEVLDRFVVQLYNLEMYDVVEEVYSFDSYIWTLYQMGGLNRDDMVTISRYCKENGIDALTMYYQWPNQEYMDIARRYDLDVYVHTVNDMETIKELQNLGVKGFYTDYITPEMMVN